MSTQSDRSSAARKRALGRWDPPHWADWVVPGVTAAVWALLLTTADSLAAWRGLVFAGGPLVLLSGLHARISGYLHTKSRLELSVLPLAPNEHFRAALRRHRVGLLTTLATGSIAVAISLVATRHDLRFGYVQWGLIADWCCLALVAWLTEPLIPAVSAALGRRFDPESQIGSVQQRAGGSWTMPEAVIHLYAPALGVGLAAALAMVPQLAIDVWVDSQTVSEGFWLASAIALMLAVGARIVAPRIYAHGMFEAVPFVAEATRTLAGPPIPEPTPWWIAAVKDPLLRLNLLSFWRGTPLPAFRLGLLALACALAAAVAEPGAAHATLVVATTLLWLLPAISRPDALRARARFVATLPLPQAQRNGGHRIASALLVAPPLAASFVVALRFGGLW